MDKSSPAAKSCAGRTFLRAGNRAGEPGIPVRSGMMHRRAGVRLHDHGQKYYKCRDCRDQEVHERLLPATSKASIGPGRRPGACLRSGERCRGRPLLLQGPTEPRSPRPQGEDRCSRLPIQRRHRPIALSRQRPPRTPRVYNRRLARVIEAPKKRRASLPTVREVAQAVRPCANPNTCWRPWVAWPRFWDCSRSSYGRCARHAQDHAATTSQRCGRCAGANNVRASATRATDSPGAATFISQRNAERGRDLGRGHGHGRSRTPDDLVPRANLARRDAELPRCLSTVSSPGRDGRCQ